MEKGFPAEFIYEKRQLVNQEGVGNDADQPLIYIGQGRFVSPTDPDQLYIFIIKDGRTHLMIDEITPWGGERDK
jgi:hypothetical protein